MTFQQKIAHVTFGIGWIRANIHPLPNGRYVTLKTVTKYISGISVQ